MPLRALRLFTLPTRPDTILASSLSFATTLQLAAGKAWTRRVVAHAQPINGGTRGFCTTRQCQTAPIRTERDTSAQAGPSTIRNISQLSTIPNIPFKKSSDAVKHTKKKTLRSPPKSIERGEALRSVASFDSQYPTSKPSDAEISKSEHSYSEESLGDIPRDDLPNFANTQPLNPRNILQAPSSHTELYQSLLSLINNATPRPRLPALVDYHEYHHRWQSTASFNLLISLAIRHQSYGTSHRLINDLSQLKLEKNVETYQLEVRNLVHQGLWNHAWVYVQKLKDFGVFPKKKSDGIEEIPLPIWLEFFRPVKKPPIEQRLIYDEEGQLVQSFFEQIIETQDELKARQGYLKRNRPRSMSVLSQSSAHAIYCIVQLLIRSGDKTRALSLTQAFFRSAPRYLKHSDMRWCREIIHVHMASSSAKHGLSRFYDARRTMVSLLKLHRSLRPNSKTLHLLLAPLKRVKICGTKAFKTLNKFKKEWGPFVEDKRVQRRVANLALKEGRMDIVRKMVLPERLERRARRRRCLSEDRREQTVYQIGPLPQQTRLPRPLVYPGQGREARLWYRLRARIQRRVWIWKRFYPWRLSPHSQ